MHCTSPHHQRLPFARYKRSTHRVVNSLLRSKLPLEALESPQFICNAEDADTVALIHIMSNTMVPIRDVLINRGVNILYRGTGKEEFKHCLNSDKDEPEVGLMFFLPSFTSTSTAESAVKTFSRGSKKGYIIVISLHQSTATALGFDFHGFSTLCGGEREVLLDRGTVLVVTDVVHAEMPNGIIRVNANIVV